MLINYDQHINKLNDYRKGKIQKAYSLGNSEFDEAFRLVKGHLCFILGHNNVGKTHFTFYLMLLYAMKHGIKYLVFSSENDPYQLIKKQIQFIDGKPLNKVEDSDYKKSLEFVKEHFQFVDTNRQYTYKELLQLAESVKEEWDYDVLLIDPINSLRKDLRNTNGYEYNYEQLTDIRIFCKKYDIAVWICAHAVTEALRRKHGASHEMAGQVQPPSAGDSEGGAVNSNRCDEMICIHRYTSCPNSWMYTRLYTLKVKEISLGFKPTSYESPLMFKSVLNNVGFELSGKNLVTYKTKKQLKAL